MYSRAFKRNYDITDKTNKPNCNLPRAPIVLARLSDIQNEMAGLHEYLANRSEKSAEFHDLKLTVYQDFEAIEALWCRFERSAACFVYQRFAFCRTWYETMSVNAQLKLHMVVVSDPTGEPVMLVPLYLQKGRFGTVLHFVGEGMADYLAPLVQDDFANATDQTSFVELWQDILATIDTNVDLVWLDRQPVKIIDVKNPMTHLLNFEFASSSHALNFPKAKDWAQAARLIRSNKTAKKIERRARQLSKQGKVELVEVTDDADRQQHMQRLLALKIENLNETGTLHRMDKPDIAAFYQALVTDPAMQKNLHQFELLCGSKMMASVLGFTHHDTFYYQICAFNREEFSQYSPGLLLQYKLFDWSFSNGLKRFDMTIGDEGYKQDWSNSTTALVTVAAAQSFKGRLEYELNRTLLRTKKTLKASPVVRSLFSTLVGK